MESLRPIRQRRIATGSGRHEFAEAPPAAALRHLVRGYCAYDERTPGFTTRRELPGTRAFLLINLGEPVAVIGGDGGQLRLGAGQAFVSGMHTRPAFSQSPGAQSGVHVWLSLGALHGLLRCDMDALQDRVVDVRALCGAGWSALGERLGSTTGAAPRFDLLDAALNTAFAEAGPAERAVDWAVARLRADPATMIAALAADIGWSGRHFTAQFRRRIGVGPRRFARLLRFGRLMRQLRAGGRANWAQLAAAHGYADQPHLVREVHAFSGLTPSALRARLAPDGGFVEA